MHYLQVAAYHKVVASMQQSSVQPDTTGQYASPSETVDGNKNQKVGNCNHIATVVHMWLHIIAE